MQVCNCPDDGCLWLPPPCGFQGVLAHMVKVAKETMFQVVGTEGQVVGDGSGDLHRMAKTLRQWNNRSSSPVYARGEHDWSIPAILHVR
jgi:hypothetical protein